MTITQRKKIAKIGNFIFLSIQPIPDLSCIFERLKKKALSQLRICRPLPLRSGQKLMKDAECAEKNGEYNLKILRFLFYELSRKLIEN